jgi:hypothetical protein
VEEQEQKIESCCVEVQTNEEVIAESSECSTDQPESSEQGE